MIRFKVGELSIRAESINQTATLSRDTGKSLYELEVEFSAHQDAEPAIQAALATGKGLLVSGDQEPFRETPIGIRQKQHSFTVGVVRQTYIWTLTQTEELTLEALRIGDVTVQPYKAEYRFDGDALIITARVEVGEDIVQRFRELPQYFAVVRQGISEEPRSMRFGQCIWSETAENRTKVQLVLVEQIRDKQPGMRGFLEPQTSNVRDSLAVTNARFHKLFETLKTKRIFTEEELNEIIVVSDAELREQKMRFDQVDDLDEFLGDEA